MTHLYFRIALLSQAEEELDLRYLQQCVEKCDLVVLSMGPVELDRTKEAIHPEILECLVDVHAEDQNVISNRSKVDVYIELASKWGEVTRLLSDKRPVLQFNNDECFLRKRVAKHGRLQLFSLSFGVQPRFGEYLCYSTLADNSVVSFYHDVKEIEIFRATELESSGELTCISYKHIRNIFASLGANKFDLYLDLINTPLFYFVIGYGEKEKRFHDLPFHIDKQVAGRSNLVRLRFFNISKCFELLSCLRFRCNKIPVCILDMSVVNKEPPVMPSINFTHFGCAYMWMAVVERTYLILEQAPNIKTAMEYLLNYSRQNAECLEKVLAKVLFLIDSGRLLNYWKVIDILFESLLSYRQSDDFQDYVVPSKCRLIRRVTFTPTRTILWPPDLMCENRILRNFESEYFLRVTFRDDDFCTLNMRQSKANIFTEAVTNHMLNGIVIGDRKYEMLAWSSSQLKDHGVAMYAEDSRGRTAADIRRWTEMDPKTKMNIPKCLARIGQCFSQTEDTVHVPLNDTHIRFESDIEHGNNANGQPFIFSDGVGKISGNLAEKVQEKFKNHKKCSAFQIRYGGCKGMLVIDPTLKDADIVFRNSMKKFDCRGSGHTKLEIAKRSGPIPMRLNRPFIAILNDLGIEHRVFLKLQENMLQNLIDILLDEVKAAQYLNSRTPFSDFKVKELSQSGLSITTEPFFRSLLLALHRYSIDLIKSKANVDLDPDYARNMFGVMDETGILQYGEVFVQYSSDTSQGTSTPDDAKILEGTVLVTKFPCIHPGDVRKFKAINVPQLHHIVDCIVFPQNGHRPHPDEISGSDLDGDEYAVVWMDELIFRSANKTAADYVNPNVEVYKNVEEFLLTSKNEEIVRFIVDYIKNDQIGNISNCHLAMADRESIFHRVCLSIARKHALAVDFAKTGYAERLALGEIPKMYPDFMEKPYSRKYRSKKSLGKMYRVSRDFEVESHSSFFKYHNIQVDKNLIVEGWEKFEQSAILEMNQYNSRLKTVLQIYGIEHEAEAFGGAFLKFHLRFNIRRDRAEIVNLVHTWLQELIAKTQENFYENRGFPLPVKELTEDVKRKASAWYIVTYRQKDPEFLSFPWVVSDILSNIYILRPKQALPELLIRIPLLVKFEGLILKQEKESMLRKLSKEASYFFNSLHYHCNPIVVERAVSILSKWAEDEKLITMTKVERDFLYYETFLKVIEKVATNEKYVCRQGSRFSPCKDSVDDTLTTAGLIIAFFKFCIKLRFIEKSEVRTIIPFDVYKYNILAKRAIVTFHSIAVRGVFPTLFYEENLRHPPELVEMKEVFLPSSMFGRYGVEESLLRNVEDIWKREFEVEEITLRENRQKRKVVVGAYGTIFSLNRLKSILRMKPSALEIKIQLSLI